MKSFIAATAAVLAIAAAAFATTPGDAATPRQFDTVAAPTAVEYFAFEPMEITARPAGIVMEPLVITVDRPDFELIELEPLHIVAFQDATTPVPAF